MRQRSATEEGAQKTAEKYGADAVPFLIEMLEGETPARTKGRIAYYLGKFRDARGFQAMIALIERPLPEVMTEDELHMIHFTIVALGFTGNDVALRYLQRLAGEEYWLSRAVHPRIPEVKELPYYRNTGMDEQVTRRELRRYAVLALGLAGNEQAIEILEELKEGAVKDIDVGTWLREAKRRQKDGPPWTWVHYDKYGRRYRVTP